MTPTDKQVRDFLSAARNLEDVVESDMTWEEKYNLIFEAGMRDCVLDIGIPVTWNVMAYGHEGAVTSFANAVLDKAQELE